MPSDKNKGLERGRTSLDASSAPSGGFTLRKSLRCPRLPLSHLSKRKGWARGFLDPLPVRVPVPPVHDPGSSVPVLPTTHSFARDITKEL